MGARGERGPVGPASLISVKDRDGLFDLEPVGEPLPATNRVELEAKERRLVFVESEQMLVVGTSSGWRPVQLLAPLRDFRKAIAKFSLNSPDQRRRLLEMDNSIKPMRHGSGDDDNESEVAVPISSQSRVAGGLGARAKVAGRPRDSVGLDGQEDEAEVGGEEDEDEDDDDDEDDDNEEEDGEEEDEWIGEDGRRLAGPIVNKASGRDNLPAGSESKPSAQSRAIGGSAGAAALVSASIDNSLQSIDGTATLKQTTSASPLSLPVGVTLDDERKLKVS